MPRADKNTDSRYYSQLLLRVKNVKTTSRYDAKLSDELLEKNDDEIFSALESEDNELKRKRRLRKGRIKNLLYVIVKNFALPGDGRLSYNVTSDLPGAASAEVLNKNARIIQEVMRRRNINGHAHLHERDIAATHIIAQQSSMAKAAAESAKEMVAGEKIRTEHGKDAHGLAQESRLMTERSLVTRSNNEQMKNTSMEAIMQRMIAAQGQAAGTAVQNGGALSQPDILAKSAETRAVASANALANNQLLNSEVKSNAAVINADKVNAESRALLKTNREQRSDEQLLAMAKPKINEVGKLLENAHAERGDEVNKLASKDAIDKNMGEGDSGNKDKLGVIANTESKPNQAKSSHSELRKFSNKNIEGDRFASVNSAEFKTEKLAASERNHKFMYADKFASILSGEAKSEKASDKNLSGNVKESANGGKFAANGFSNSGAVNNENSSSKIDNQAVKHETNKSLSLDIKGDIRTASLNLKNTIDINSLNTVDSNFKNAPTINSASKNGGLSLAT